MTARTPRTLCHLLTIMFPRQRGGLQLSQATQTAASSAAMSGLPVDSCWHFCKVAGCQQTKCVNLAFGCSIGLRFTAVPTTGLWYCWRAWSGSVTGPPHVYMRCTLWVALKAFWWSELVPSQTPPRKKKKKKLAATPPSVVARGACAKPQCVSSYLFSNCLLWRRFAALQILLYPMFRLLLSSAGLGSALASTPDKTYASVLRICIR